MLLWVATASACSLLPVLHTFHRKAWIPDNQQSHDSCPHLLHARVRHRIVPQVRLASCGTELGPAIDAAAAGGASLSSSALRGLLGPAATSSLGSAAAAVSVQVRWEPELLGCGPGSCYGDVCEAAVDRTAAGTV